jgi:Holliday junction DNA helicase RuvB
VLKLDFYSGNDLEKIIVKNAFLLDLEMEKDLVSAIANRSRGTPRISNRILKIMRDYKII